MIDSLTIAMTSHSNSEMTSEIIIEITSHLLHPRFFLAEDVGGAPNRLCDIAPKDLFR